MVTNVKEIIALEENATSRFLKFVNEVLKPLIDHVRDYHLNHKDELIDIKQIDNLEVLIEDYIKKEYTFSQLIVNSKGSLEIKNTSDKLNQLVSGLMEHCNKLRGILELVKKNQENAEQIEELIIKSNAAEQDLREIFSLIHRIKVRE